MFFNFFDIFIFPAVRGVKGQKIAQKNNNYIRHAPYLRNSIAYDHDFFTLVENDDISRCFFHFFDIPSFWAVRGVKG